MTTRCVACYDHRIACDRSKNVAQSADEVNTNEPVLASHITGLLDIVSTQGDRIDSLSRREKRIKKELKKQSEKIIALEESLKKNEELMERMENLEHSTSKLWKQLAQERERREEDHTLVEAAHATGRAACENVRRFKSQYDYKLVMMKSQFKRHNKGGFL